MDAAQIIKLLTEKSDDFDDMEIVLTKTGSTRYQSEKDKADVAGCAAIHCFQSEE